MKYRLEATRVRADADAEMVVPHSLDLMGKTTTLQATAQSLAVSVLDLVATRASEPPGSAIARSVELARHVEQLGYKRYWVAEHHAIQGLACSATPVLIGHIAAATKTIRVGSGGVMLPNHAPLVVAEQFGTLEAIYPGRIDLGLGRAPGGDFQAMRALRHGLAQDGNDFPSLIEELRTYLGPERPGQVVKAVPGQNSNVPITVLGSSGFSAQLAATLGLPFAFAAHWAPEYLHSAAQLYRERFRPSHALRKPYLFVGAGDCGRKQMPQLGDCSLLHSSVFCERFGASRRNCCLPSIQWSTHGMTQSERLWRTDYARRSWDGMQPCRLGWRDCRAIRVPMK